MTRLSAALLAILLVACGAAPAAPAAPAASPPVAAAPAIPTEATTLAAVGLDASALDRTADPCRDFYQFACGGWIARTTIPGDESGWYRSFDEIQKRNEADLRALLEAAAKDPGADPARQKIGTFYGACMDEAAVEAAGARPLGWLRTAVDLVKTPADLAPVLATLHAVGIRPLFRLSVEQDARDATRMIATIDQGGLGLPDRDDYLRTDDKSVQLRKIYLDHVGAMLTLAGMPRAKATAAAVLVVALETELAKVSKTRTERRDPKALFNPIGLAGVQKAAPAFDWPAYFQHVRQPQLVDLSVTSPQFVEGVGRLLTTQPVATWRHYLTWHAIRGAAPLLSKAFVDEDFRLERALTGATEQRPRWRRCIEATDAALGEVLAQPYVAARFAGGSKAAAEQMVAAIGKAFVEAARGLAWMDAATRDKALQKQAAMAFLIGYPDTWRAYDFPIALEQFAQNSWAARAFDIQRNLARLGKPVDRSEWQMSPPTVNAYYDPQKNHMVFPAGILQPPFFDVNAGVAVNLGGIGMVIGHELTHGFDDEGSQFDASGNLVNWWTPAVQAQFATRTGCVADQFAAYEVQPGLFVNGRLTLGENIADLGGLKLALAAYRALRKDAPTRLVADGFTEDQQFFLANAQVWCGKMRPEAERQRVLTNPHSPPKFRVNGPLANLPAFAEAFQCQPGTPMRPATTCSVW